MARKLYLAAYDVREAARLRQALRVARDYACGGQKSVHECWLSRIEYGGLVGEMHGVLDLDADSLALIPLEVRRPVSTLGIAVAPADPRFFYFA